MAFNTVVRLVQRTGEVCTGIGQLEAFAKTQMITVQLKPDKAVHLDFPGIDQVVRVELTGNFEENARFMLRFSLRRKRCPGGITGGELELRGILHFALEPAGDLGGKTEVA